MLVNVLFTFFFIVIVIKYIWQFNSQTERKHIFEIGKPCLCFMFKFYRIR